MDKKKITIVTGTGGILGTGHFQRMLNLAVSLNLTDSFTASIFLKQDEFPLDKKFTGLIAGSIPDDSALIIRDMRDSSVAEIQQLKDRAPVLAIDDSGTGRESADFSLNLLPVPSEGISIIKPEKSLFLYGLNFAEGIRLLQKRNTFERDIDLAVYTGFDPSNELISLIRQSVPDALNSVLLAGGKAVNLTGNLLQKETPYAEILSRSKTVATHFGLTMFEADVCGCRIAALNPTEYHSTLTEIISNDFNIIFSSEYNNFKPEVLKKIIENESENTCKIEFSPSEILNKINTGTEKFINFIKSITNKTD